MENDDILVEISTLSECETDAKYIRDIKVQSFLLGLLGAILLFIALEIYFNNGEILQIFTHQSSFTHPSIFVVFLIAALGNVIASRLLYSEARTEEYQLKKIKAAFLANSILK